MKLFDSFIRACISLKQPGHDFRVQETEKEATKIAHELEKDHTFKYIICNDL